MKADLTHTASSASTNSERGRASFGSRQEHLRSIALAWQLARLDLVRRYTTTMLGLAWAVVAPLLMAAVIGVVFAKLFGVELRTFLPYLFMNLTLWGFFLAALDGGAISFLAAEGYIKQIPKVSLFTYPLRMIFAAIVTLVLGLCAASFVSVLFGGPIGWNWLWALPGLVFWFAFGFALACISGVFNTALRDFQYIQSVGAQALFYATPVMFPADLLVGHGLGWLLTYNPIYHLMFLVRVPILLNEMPPLANFLAAGAAVVVTLLFAYLVVARARLRLVFWL